MKPTITIKKTYCTIRPIPKKDIKCGLRVFLSFSPNENVLPIMTTDIRKGQKKYPFSKEMCGKVIDAEFVVVDNSVSKEP